MTSLMCPKCRQAVSDDALDAGQCPSCGYDGPMVSLVAGAKWAWLVSTLAVVTGGLALGGYLLFRQPPPQLPSPEVAVITPAAVTPVVLPPAPQTAVPMAAQTAPEPRPVVPAPPPKKEPVAVAPMPVAVVPPKKEPPKLDPPAGPVVRINAREVRDKQLDLPRGVASVVDMNGEDRLTLTGKVRLLKIGTVGGKATLDTSGLDVEEIVITGDLSQSAVVKLNAPGGKITIGGHVVGSAKLTVNAPGGDVIVSAGSARFDNGSEITVTAKRVEVNGLMTGGATLLVTLTAGGSLKLGVMDGGATVIYKRAAPTDPEPKVEPGELRGGAKVLAGY